MNAQDLLKEDLLMMMRSRPTRGEAEVMAGRIINSLEKVIDEKIESYVGEDQMEDDSDGN